MLSDETLHGYAVLHAVLNDLLQDVIEVIPVDILVFIQALEVDINHFIYLLCRLRFPIHVFIVGLTRAIVAFLVGVVVEYAGQCG